MALELCEVVHLDLSPLLNLLKDDESASAVSDGEVPADFVEGQRGEDILFGDV